jgi:hypothetical protein
MNHDEKRIQMLLVLSTTKELLMRSTVNGWPDESPNEALDVINKMIDHLFDVKLELPKYWDIQFSPTGPIQEIAMSNGWSNAYLTVSGMFDDAISAFK